MMHPFSILFALFAILCTGVSGIPAPATDGLPDGLSVGSIINALGLGFVTNIDVNITLDTLTDNLVTIDFEAKNPLIIELTIDRIVTTASLNGTTYAQFDKSFPLPGGKPLILPILGSANSGPIPNVLLTQGAIASLNIIPDGVFDLGIDVYLRAATIFGKLGIPIPITGLKQKGVKTTYNLDLAAAAKLKALSGKA